MSRKIRRQLSLVGLLTNRKAGHRAAKVRDRRKLLVESLENRRLLAYNVTLSAAATSNGSFAGGVFTPTGDDANVSFADLNTELAAETNVTINTNNGAGGQAGDVTLQADYDFNGVGMGRMLTLTAAEGVSLQGMISDSAPGGDSLNLVFDADSDMSGTGSILVEGNIQTTGTVTFQDGTALEGSAALSVSGNDILVQGDAVVTNANGVTLGASGGNVSITGDITSAAAASDLTLNAIGGDVSIGGDIGTGLALQNLTVVADSVSAAGANLTGTLSVTNTGTGAFTGVISGSVAVNKLGAGNLTLGGANTYNGTTTVSAGSLLVTGALADGPSDPDVAVQAGATLGGTGTINGSVEVNTGTLAPGLSPGILNTSDLTIVASGSLNAEVNGPTAGADYDQVVVSGSVSIAGATLNLSGSGAVMADDTIILIDNDGMDAVVGTFAGLPEGADISVGSATGVITYSGGDGNDVELLIAGAVTYDASPGENYFELRQPAVGMVELLAGADQGSAVSVDLRPLDIVTSYTVNGADGDDLLVVNYAAGGEFELNVNFNGQGQDGAPGDTLEIAGGTADEATFNYTNANNGNVQIDFDGGGVDSTITYTGLEPISSTINANNVTLQYSGAAETITVTDAGGGQTTVNSTAGEMTTFNNPALALEIDGGGGNDTIDVVSLLASYPADIDLFGGGSTDTVVFNGAVSLAAGRNLAVATTDTINVNSALSVSGAGNVSFQADRNVSLSAGSSITSTDGAIAIAANSGGASTGTVDGIQIDGASVQSGSGAISMTSVGGNVDGSGIHLTNGGQVTTTSGAISLTGTGAGAGVRMTGASTTVSSATGAVQVNGNSSTAAGLSMDDTTLITSTGGDVNIDTTGDVDLNDMATISAASGNITVDAAGGGAIDMEDETQITAASGSADLDADSGITLGGVSAPQVLVTTTGGGIVDGGDTLVDISATSAALRATAGIGSGNALDTDVATLAAANSAGGDIQIDNASSGSILQIDTVDGLAGVANSGAGDTRLTAFDLNVVAPVSATSDVELFSSNPTRTFGLGSGPAVKGSGITTASAAFGLDDAELDLITAGGFRRVIGDSSVDLINVNYDGSDTQRLDVLGADGDDEFFVAPSTTMPINLNGGLPSAPTLPGDTLHLDMTGSLPVVIVDTIGGYAISASTAIITFQEFETLDLCDDSGEIENAEIGDLYVRTTNAKERVIFTSWSDRGVKLRIDDLDARQSTTFPQHFGLLNGAQLIQEILVYAQDGNDSVTIAGHVIDSANAPIPVEFHGEDGNDYLGGGNGDDLLVGGPGKDRVLGGNGDNSMFGDGNEFAGGALIELPTDGNDYLAGRGDNDTLWGGGGKDKLIGSSGDDVLNGGGSDDYLAGGRGIDILRGGEGDDVMQGSYDADILIGGGGDDLMYGGAGDDILIGGLGGDNLRGDRDDDLLAAGTTDQDDETDAALLAVLLAWSTGGTNNLTGNAADSDGDGLVGGTGVDLFWADVLPEPPLDNVVADSGEIINDEP